MRKFLKVSLKFQWKTILVIFALIVIQTFFQMEIIDLFSAALTGVKEQNIDLLVKSGSYMLMYTFISVIAIYIISFLSTKVASNAAYTVREKIFHILMNLPSEELEQFKISGLVTRSTRGMSSEQGFIVIILTQLMLVPVTLVAIIYEIALIDTTYALFFLAFVGVLGLLLIFRMKQIVKIFFRAKKTYRKLNLLFLSKILMLDVVNLKSFHDLSQMLERLDHCCFKKKLELILLMLWWKLLSENAVNGFITETSNINDHILYCKLVFKML